MTNVESQGLRYTLKAVMMWEDVAKPAATFSVVRAVP